MPRKALRVPAFTARHLVGGIPQRNLAGENLPPRGSRRWYPDKTNPSFE